MSRRSSRNVDESLFATNKRNSRRGSRHGGVATGVISKSKLKTLLSGESDTAVLSASSLVNLKDKSRLTQEDRTVLTSSNRREILAKRSAARQARMKKNAKIQVFKSGADLETEDNNKAQALLARAQRMRDEDHDDIKHMKQLMMSADCATIREQQIADKLRRIQLEKEEDHSMHVLMENDRLRRIREIEEREREKHRRKMEDAIILDKQIKDVQRRRYIAKEAAEQEAEEMLRRIKANEERKLQEEQAKIEYGRKLNREVLAANDAAARVRARRKQMEADEDLRILAYIKAKEKREREEDERLAAIKAAKEAETIRLRRLQERAIDNRGEIDQLRAKRYQQGRDRAWRLAEKEKALRQQEMQRDMHRVRTEQKLFKERQANEFLKEDQEIHLRALLWQRQKQAEDDGIAAAKYQQRVSNQKEVLSQIEVKRAQRKQKQQEFFRSGDHVKKQQAEEVARLERIRQEKLNIMTKKGVPEKFRVKVANKKILQAKLMSASASMFS